MPTIDQKLFSKTRYWMYTLPDNFANNDSFSLSATFWSFPATKQFPSSTRKKVALRNNT